VLPILAETVNHAAVDNSRTFGSGSKAEGLAAYPNKVSQRLDIAIPWLKRAAYKHSVTLSEIMIIRHES
jgi:hypothetical protein